MKRKILITLVVFLVVIQFFRIDKSTVQSNPEDDFITVFNPPANVRTTIKEACYNCHSYSTVYPWYSNIAPISWWLKKHVNEAREHLNFATWKNLSAKKANHKLEECVEEVKEGEMPLNSYTWTHPEARLTKDQRKILTTWFQEQYESTKLKSEY